MSVKIVWKFIIILCFIFSIGTASILLIYEKLVNNFITSEVIIENNLFKKLFIQNVYKKYPFPLEINQDNINVLKKQKYYNEFIEEINDLIKYIDNLESLCLYDQNSNIIFQYNSKCIAYTNKPTMQSIEKIQNNNIVIKDIISSKYNEQYVSYIINFNKSADLIKINNLTITIAAIEIILLLSSLVTIIYISKYLIQLLKKQFEISLEIKKEKDDLMYSTDNRSLFFTNIVHELRTPLNSIIGFTKIILQSNIDQLTREHLEKINTSSNELLIFICDILDFSKAEANQLEISNKFINLNSTIKNVIKLMSPLFKEKNINIITEINENSLIINADPNRLRQVFKNILSNSIKFSNFNSNIIIKIIRLSGRIEISIIDEGIGIPEDDIANAMNIFGQSSNSNISYKGTGLGLPLSKKLIECMGAHFFITSKKGAGTTIKLTFPINDELLYDEKEAREGLMK